MFSEEWDYVAVLGSGTTILGRGSSAHERQMIAGQREKTRISSRVD